MTDTEKPATLVKPKTGSRLELLAAAYRDAAKAADEANKRLTEIKDAIKVELSLAQPDSEDIRLWSPVLEKPLHFHYIPPSWYVDSKRMKKEDPVTYVKWAKEKAGYWKLEAA